MTCKDCAHYDVCVIIENSADDEDYLTEFGCEDFKDKSSLIEVVLCEKCKYRNKEGFCFKNINGVGYKLVLPNDFCSYGEHESSRKDLCVKSIKRKEGGEEDA